MMGEGKGEGGGVQTRYEFANETGMSKAKFKGKILTSQGAKYLGHLNPPPPPKKKTNPPPTSLHG